MEKIKDKKGLEFEEINLMEKMKDKKRICV